MNLHVELLERATRALGDIEVVFVGGAALPLLFDAGTEDAARETDDADCIVLVRTRAEHARLEARLRRRGLAQPPHKPGPICRWWAADGLVIDVMPVSASILGFTNRWYEAAYYNAFDHALPSGQVIRIPRAPWFLATKIEAYRSRGAKDPYASRDLEDIIALVASRASLAAEIARQAGPELRAYLRAFFAEFAAAPEHGDWIAGHLPPPRTERHVEEVEHRLTALVALDTVTDP